MDQAVDKYPPDTAGYFYGSDVEQYREPDRFFLVRICQIAWSQINN
jgi:hypothetical protein